MNANLRFIGTWGRRHSKCTKWILLARKRDSQNPAQNDSCSAAKDVHRCDAITRCAHTFAMFEFIAGQRRGFRPGLVSTGPVANTPSVRERSCVQSAPAAPAKTPINQRDLAGVLVSWMARNAAGTDRKHFQNPVLFPVLNRGWIWG